MVTHEKVWHEIQGDLRSPVPSLLMSWSVAMMKSEAEYDSYCGRDLPYQLPDELRRASGLFGTVRNPVNEYGVFVDVESTTLPMAQDSKYSSPVEPGSLCQQGNRHISRASSHQPARIVSPPDTRTISAEFVTATLSRTMLGYGPPEICVS